MSRAQREPGEASIPFRSVGLGILAALLLGLSLYHFAHGARSIRSTGFVDFPIFLEQTARFQITGVLYPVDEGLSRFSPAAPVYKFPPLYALLLLPVVKFGTPERVYLGHWLLQMTLYLLAVALSLAALPRRPTLLFGVVIAILALNYEPFLETLWRLQIETVLLLLLASCLYLLLRERQAAAGALVGICVMLKVYPAFLLLYFLVRRRWVVLLWCAVSLALTLVAQLIVIGPGQNAVYFFEVLPHLLREAPAAVTENLGLGRYLQTLFGVGPAAARFAGRLLALPLLAVTLLAVCRRTTNLARRDRTPLELAAFVALLLLILPNSWANYQLLLLLPIVVLLGQVGRPEVCGPAVLLPTLLAYGLMLFYAPCAEPSVPWPCAQTPPFLGLHPLPRPLHDLLVGFRGLAAPLLWGTCLYLLSAAPARSGEARLAERAGT